MRKDILKYLEKNEFYRELVYSFIPVICFESALKGYINNSIVKKLGIKKVPKGVVVLDKKFESWNDQNIEKIKNKKQIEYIIAECRKVIKKHEKKVEEIWNYNFSKLKKDKIVKTLRLVDKINTEIYKNYGFLIEEYFETSDKRLIKLLPEIRIKLSDLVTKIYEICDFIIEDLSKRFDKISWKTFTYATFDEIVSLLKNPTAKNVGEFKKIYKKPILFFINDRKLWITRDSKTIVSILSILKNQEKERNKEAKKQKEIKGLVAFKGIARGRVVKISENDYKDISKKIKNKKDYILVTPMTRPEFILYIKKCKAIVTNEGGITCHAAIISRELKKPCIVGTKIATKVLKDGDLVEVDANKGIVRILKKK